MNNISKIAIHSFGYFFVLILLLILSIAFDTNEIGQYIIAGLASGRLLSMLFSRRKYLISITQNDNSITVDYCGSLLRRKQVTFDWHTLEAVIIEEKSWWNGRLTRLNLYDSTTCMIFLVVQDKSSIEIADLNI